MISDAIFSQLKSMMREALSCSAHDISHGERVYQMACHLAETEHADRDVIRAAAILHDIARTKEDEDTTGATDHAVLGAQMSRSILLSLGCPPEFAGRVSSAILKHRFKGGVAPETIEEKIIYDADKLDIIGAVGIARSFMIAGQYGQLAYANTNIDDYMMSNLVGGTKSGRIKDMKKHAPNIEFELKMKSIPNRLFTETARRIAKERIKLMENFFAILKADTEVNRDL